MIEPYLIDIGIEVLKIIIGIAVPLITIMGTIYANKFRRRFERNEVQREIDHIARFAQQLGTFQSMNIEDRIDAIMDEIQYFVMQNNINISQGQLRLMVEKSLIMPRTIRKLQIMEEQNDYNSKNSQE